MSSKIYLGTRAFALKGSLLSRDAIQTLAESTSLDELVNRLKGTPYSDVVSKLQPPFSARQIELALRERLADVHYTLMKSGSKYEIFELYYLRDIAWDLKASLKAKTLNKSYEETIEYLDLHSEELIGRRDLIAKVLSAKDVQEAVALLSGTEFGQDVEKALSAYLNTGEVRFFDLYVDHAILTRISKAYVRNSKIYSGSHAVEVGGVGEMVAIDIDSYNVLSILRAKLWKLPADEMRQLIILPTFKFPAALLQGMIDAESAAEALKLLPFELQSELGDEESIAQVEERFLAESKQAASRAFVWQGLGPASALALIKLLEFEVRNLSAIAIGVEAHIPTKELVSRLRL